MLSWVRTATSLITFGFSVYKFFQLERDRTRVHEPVGADSFALALVLLGMSSLVLATMEYKHALERLGREFPHEGRHLALYVAAFVAALGVLALVLIVFKK